MGNNFVSLKPRLQNARRAPPRATGALKSNMADNRIQKQRISTKKQRSQSSTTLKDHFEHTISAYRDELDLETNRQLDRTESDLNRQLAHITKEFSEKLELVAKFENDIFNPISEEELAVTIRSPEKGGQDQIEDLTLAERMRDFEILVAEKAAHLESLWKAWHATHLELVCLAIEVLGLDGVELAFDHDNKTIAAKINAVVDANKEHEARRTLFKEEATKLERSIRTVAQETVNNLSDQEKEWKINERKKIQKIKQIMMEAD